MAVASPSLLARPPRVLLANHYPFRRDETVGPHWSESDLFLATTEGRGAVRVGPRRFELASGDVLHVPWAAPVEYRADRTHPFILIGVHLEYRPWTTDEGPAQLRHHARGDLDRNRMCEPPVPQPWESAFIHRADRRSRLLDTAKDLATAFEHRIDPDREARLRALALMFLIELRAVRDGALAQESHPSAGAVRDIASWLDLSHARSITRAEIAARAGMSESALAAAFGAVTGKPPISYLIDIRMGHAARMLRTSSMRVCEIAERVGVPDVFHFSKLFKKRLGMSPLRYRKRQRL